MTTVHTYIHTYIQECYRHSPRNDGLAHAHPIIITADYRPPGWLRWPCNSWFWVSSCLFCFTHITTTIIYTQEHTSAGCEHTVRADHVSTTPTINHVMMVSVIITIIVHLFTNDSNGRLSNPRQNLR